jgi:hypothetical protein
MDTTRNWRRSKVHRMWLDQRVSTRRDLLKCFSVRSDGGSAADDNNGIRNFMMAVVVVSVSSSKPRLSHRLCLCLRDRHHPVDILPPVHATAMKGHSRV